MHAVNSLETSYDQPVIQNNLYVEGQVEEAVGLKYSLQGELDYAIGRPIRTTFFVTCYLYA